MKTFSTIRRTEHASLVERLRHKQGQLEAAIRDFNENCSDQYAHVAAARDALQEVMDEANTFLESLREDAQNYFDDRSEKWQEDEAGQQYQEWINEIEQAEIPTA